MKPFEKKIVQFFTDISSQIEEVLEAVKTQGQGKKAPGHFDYKIGLSTPKKGELKMLDISLTNEEKVKVTITPVTSTGKPAKLDGTPTWTVTSGRSTVDVATDGLSAFLVSSDEPGDSVVLVEADADLGAGIQTISDTIQLHVLGANASSLGLKAEPPIPK